MTDFDWRDITWKHVALVALALAAIVAMSFAPSAGCSVKVTDSPTTTTTEPAK